MYLEKITAPITNLTRVKLEELPILLSTFEQISLNDTIVQIFWSITLTEKDDIILFFENLNIPLDLEDYVPRYISVENIIMGVTIVIARE